MSKALTTIAALAATAMNAADTSTEAASVAKFDAIVSFAALSAASLRKVINTGANLETDSKGRIDALVQGTKADRTAFLAALVAARGLSEADGDDKRLKDINNFASMSRTVALHFIPMMVATGSIRDAASADDMAAIIRERLLTATGGLSTYKGLEAARGRKWEAPAIEVEAPAVSEAEAEAEEGEEADPFAITPDAPEQEQEAPAVTLEAEVASAIRAIRSAMERDDLENLTAHGFRALLTEGLAYVQAAEKAEKAAQKALATA